MSEKQNERRKSLPAKATPTKKLLKLRQTDSPQLAEGLPYKRVLASDLEQKLPSKPGQELFPRPEQSSEEVFDVAQLWGSFPPCQQIEHSSEEGLGTTQFGSLDVQDGSWQCGPSSFQTEPQEEPPSHDDHRLIPVASRVPGDASSCRGCFQPQPCPFQAAAFLGELARDVTPTRGRLKSCFSRLLCCQKPAEETQVSLFPSAESPVAPIQPKAKAPPPPPKSAKARAPPPPPPKAKAKASSTGAWKGQKPSPQWKTDKVVNCSPIRQAGLLEGSIWQQVNQTIEQRGDEAPLCEETLNSAFMRLADGSKTPRGRKSIQTARRRKKVEKQRIFPQSLQLKADLLHSQLVRQGFADLERLQHILGLRYSQLPGPVDHNLRGPVDLNISCYTMSSSDSDDSDDSEDSDGSNSTDSDGSDSSGSDSELDWQQEPDEDTLEVLLNFLHLADGREDQLTQPSGTGMEKKRLSVSTSSISGGKTQSPLAAAEQLLQQLLTQVGSAKSMQTRVSLMLSMTRFPREVDHLENIMQIGISAANSALESTALPQLLQGYLLLVNYVNHDSQQLGSARGVTLDSLAKLAHTKCRAPSQKEGVQQKERAPQKMMSALHLLVQQVQEKQEPTWLATLTADLEDCREACEVDYAATSSGISDLAEKVTTVESYIRSLRASRADTEPSALTLVRLTQFVASATPRLANLRSMHTELDLATIKMRKYFAEPQTSPLPAMLRSLASLSDALPRPETTSSVRNLVDKFENTHSVQADSWLNRVRGQSGGG